MDDLPLTRVSFGLPESRHQTPANELGNDYGPTESSTLNFAPYPKPPDNEQQMGGR
jgi:hypothetical protein